VNAMKRFVFDEVSGFHQNVLKPKPDGPKPMNLGLVLSESLRFSTDPEPGLELVDILPGLDHFPIAPSPRSHRFPTDG